MKTNLQPKTALDLAAEAIGVSRLKSSTHKELELVVIQQLHVMNLKTLNGCRLTQETARVATDIARKAFTETQVRLELLAEELGVCQRCYAKPANDHEAPCGECLTLEAEYQGEEHA